MTFYAWQKCNSKGSRIALAVGLLLTLGFMLKNSIELSYARSDYQYAVETVNLMDRNSTVLSTQPLVESLYTSNYTRWVESPHDLVSLVEAYRKGARYLIVDPQAFISWTKQTDRFTLPLIDYMQWTYDHVKPMASFPHLNQALLTRFVLDHNEDLFKSLYFLKQAPEHGWGEIRVYDLSIVLSALKEHALKK
jgi:hypothetical protein